MYTRPPAKGSRLQASRLKNLGTLSKIAAALTTDRSMKLTLTTLLACLLLSGCTPTRPDGMALERVAALVERAERQQAETLAPIEFRFARQKLELARQATEERQRERARELLQQAALDARLALTKARAAQAVQQMNALNEQVKQLRAQLEQLQGELQ